MLLRNSCIIVSCSFRTRLGFNLRPYSRHASLPRQTNSSSTENVIKPIMFTIRCDTGSTHLATSGVMTQPRGSSCMVALELFFILFRRKTTYRSVNGWYATTRVCEKDRRPYFGDSECTAGCAFLRMMQSVRDDRIFLCPDI